MTRISYKRHRFPPPVIQHAVWHYFRFTLSLRDVEGFDAGADDYLTKPFSMAELVVRARALLRRGAGLAPSVRTAGELQIHLDAGRVFACGIEVPVTANEWRLLRLLTDRPGVAFSRATIAAEVGISQEAGEVAVDHLVSRLRIKLRPCGADGGLQTFRGIGFAWEDHPRHNPTA